MENSSKPGKKLNYKKQGGVWRPTKWPSSKIPYQPRNVQPAKICSGGRCG